MNFKIESEFYPSGFLKKHSLRKGAALWGPRISFSMDSLELIEIQYAGCRCGTRAFSHGPGYKREETYFNPRFENCSLLHCFFSGLVLLYELNREPTIRLRTFMDNSEVFADIQDFDQHLSTRRSHLLEFGAKKVYDLDAELSLSVPPQNGDGFRSDNLNQFRFPTGGISFYGYVWEEESRYWWNDETVSFWETGAVRTTSCWVQHGIRGTRSCYTPDGRLWVEQFFGLTGWENGTWINRFYNYEEEHVRVSRIEVFKRNELLRAIENPSFNTFLEDATLNHVVVPEYSFFEQR